MRTCKLEEFKSAVEAKSPEIVLVDVRTPEEYNDGHIAGSINLPLGTHPLPVDDLLNKKLYVFCETHNRSRVMGALLEKMGVADVTVYDGGMFEWQMNDGELI